VTTPKQATIISGTYEIFRGKDGRLRLKLGSAVTVAYEKDIDLVIGLQMNESRIAAFDRAERQLTRVSKDARARMVRARKAGRTMKRRESWTW
jgi:hypothetical protein